MGYKIGTVAIAMLIGAGIYLFLRPTAPVFFRWISWIGLGDFIYSARLTTLHFSSEFPNWFLYSLPDGLWAFAYAMLMFNFWWKKKSKLAFFWLSSVPLLVYGFEILQKTNVINGTFCWKDMAFQSLGILLAILMETTNKKINYEKNIT